MQHKIVNLNRRHDWPAISLKDESAKGVQNCQSVVTIKYSGNFQDFKAIDKINN